MEDDLGESTAEVGHRHRDHERRMGGNTGRLGPCSNPSAIVFVDGVRRIEARIWIDEVAGTQPASEASAALCAS